MSDTHLNAPTRYIRVDGDSSAYRRWGHAPSGQPPLLSVQHFRGGVDQWDPLLTNGLAAGREVILCNGRAIASSGGMPRNRIEEMADDIALVIQAMELSQVGLGGGDPQCRPQRTSSACSSDAPRPRSELGWPSGSDATGVWTRTRPVPSQPLAPRPRPNVLRQMPRS